MKKLTFLMTVAMLFVFTAGMYAADSPKVGYVDIEKVFNQYSGTKSAKEKLQKEVDKEQKSIEKEKDDLLKAKADLDKKRAILDKDKVKQQEQDLQNKLEKLQARAMDVQQKLMNQEKELTANIVEEIRAIVKQIAEEKKYDYVFEKSTLLFGGDDITFLVIKKINE
jgi:Skp family chaperone for outer membrane proteins